MLKGPGNFALLQAYEAVLFTPVSKYINQQQKIICRQHIELAQTDSVVGYLYKNEEVRLDPNKRGMVTRLNRALHDKQETLLEEWNTVLWHYQPRIRAFIPKFLTRAKTAKDLLMLVPPELRQATQDVFNQHKDLDRQEVTLTEAIAAEFKETYKEEYALIAERAVMNLLLQ